MRADYHLCPVCKTAQIKIATQICNHCSNISIDQIDPGWWYWFAGFFAGEGNVDIQKRINRNDRISTYMRLVICLRSDDEPILHAIQEKLGGVLSERSKIGTTSHPQTAWTLSRAADCRAVLQHLRAYMLAPAKKLRDIEIGLAWCEWRMKQGYYLENAEEGLGFIEQLRSSRIYIDY